MYGRLVEIEGVDPSKREEVVAQIRERIIPGLKEIEGFAGFISLVDEENRRARSVVLWETKEGADEAERQFAARREEMVRGMGGTVRSDGSLRGSDRRGTRRRTRLGVGKGCGPHRGARIAARAVRQYRRIGSKTAVASKG